MRRSGSVPLPDIGLSTRFGVELRTADMTHVASRVRGVELSGTRPVPIHGADPLEVYRPSMGIPRITRVSEGR